MEVDIKILISEYKFKSVLELAYDNSKKKIQKVMSLQIFSIVHVALRKKSFLNSGQMP